MLSASQPARQMAVSKKRKKNSQQKKGTYHGQTFLPEGQPCQFASPASYSLVSATPQNSVSLTRRWRQRSDRRTSRCPICTAFHQHGALGHENDDLREIHPVWWSFCTVLFSEIHWVIVYQRRQISEKDTETKQRNLVARCIRIRGAEREEKSKLTVLGATHSGHRVTKRVQNGLRT